MFSLPDPTQSTTLEADRKTESAVQCAGQNFQLFSFIDELTDRSNKHKPLYKHAVDLTTSTFVYYTNTVLF